MAGSRRPLLARLGAAAGAPAGKARLGKPTGPEDLRRAKEPGRGRQADTPLEVPPPGWKDILLRTWRQVQEDQLSLVAAGIAFYFMLALFPALLSIVTVYGVIADPATVAKQAGELVRLMPADAAQVLVGQLEEISTADGASAGFGALVAALLSLWAASNGTKALIAGLNIAYEERERRAWPKRNVLAIVLTLGFIVLVTLSLATIAAAPHLLARLPLGPFATGLTYAMNWLLLALLALLAFAVVYRFGPARERPRWQWVSVGAVVGTGLWLLASAAFSWYAARFGSFNETYGALAGGILLLLWLQITAYVTLLGAELNAEIEHQTARDSTTGPPVPLGARGAQMADTVGEAVAARAEDHRADGAGDGEAGRRPFVRDQARRGPAKERSWTDPTAP